MSTTSSSSNKRARSEQSSACTECQRRKGKCVGGRPCTFCAKTGRKCIDQPQISRIPLTRKNMDDLHDRCQRLQSLLQSIDPSIDVEDLVGGSLPSTTRYGHDRKQSSGAESSGVATPEEEVHESDGEEDMNQCKFEWHEGNPTLNDAGAALADGMAGLNIDSKEVGYLGRSSAAALLRHVCRLLKAHEQATGTVGCDLMEAISPMPSPKMNNAEKRLYASWTEDLLIDSYFRYHHASYPILHEAIFRDQVTRLRSNDLKVNTHWQTLYRMVLVTGAFMSSTDHTDPPVDMEIYKTVNDTFSTLDFLSYGTLEGVQALALMGAYLQKRDNPNTGYNCLGMAMRMALGLGLHRDVTESKGTTLGMEVRRRIWWTLYIFDVGASITFGRPTIPSDKVFTKIPMNVNDYHLTDRNAILPPPCETVTAYSAMIAHAHLVVLMNRIHLNFFIHPRSLSSCRLPLSRELIAKFDEQIARWHSALPAYFSDRNCEPWFAAPRAVVEWKAMNLRMLMYKCFLDCLSYSPVDHSGPVSSQIPANRQTHIALLPEVRKCLTFALSTLSSIRKFTNTHKPLWHGVGWYATYYVFQAALVLVTAILSVPRDASVSVWKDGVLDALMCLRTIETSTASANRVAAVLRWCLLRIEGGEVQRPCLGLFEQPIEECRISVNEYRQQMEMEYNGMLGVSGGQPGEGGMSSNGGGGGTAWNEGGYTFGQGGLGGAPFFGQFENPTPPEMDAPEFNAGAFWGDDIGLFSDAGLMGMGLGTSIEMPSTVPPPQMQSYTRIPPGGFNVS